MDPDEFLSITLTCMKRCTDEIRGKGYDPADIRAVMGDGIICGICGVNAEGDAVTPTSITLTAARRLTPMPSTPKPRHLGQRDRQPGSQLHVPRAFCPVVYQKLPQVPGKGREVCAQRPVYPHASGGPQGKDAFIDWGAMSGWGLGYKVEEKCWSDEQLGNPRD